MRIKGDDVDKSIFVGVKHSKSFRPHCYFSFLIYPASLASGEQFTAGVCSTGSGWQTGFSPGLAQTHVQKHFCFFCT